MESREIVHTVECPGCKWQISFYLTDFQGCLKLYCNRCRQMIAELQHGQPLQVFKVENGKRKMCADGKKSMMPISSEKSREYSVASPVAKPITSWKKPTRQLFSSQSLSPSISEMLDPKAPEKVGEYQIIRMIGQGNCAEIYLGRHITQDKIVAIKLLSQKMQQDSMAKERFLQEARVHSRLDHPNIVHIEDVGYCTSSKRLYLIMEYVEGESLKTILAKRGAISQKQTLKIAIAVAHALEHALKRHIIHRDLKPGNIMIDQKNRRVKVTDLGLGKILEEKGGTLNGELMGTAYYMPPEQIRNAKGVDHRADIYALGATLYHMLAGRPPYGEHKGTLNILKTKLAQNPIPLREYVANIADFVQKIVAKSMARDRKRRYQTPTQMIQDMQKALDIVKTSK